MLSPYLPAPHHSFSGEDGLADRCHRVIGRTLREPLGREEVFRVADLRSANCMRGAWDGRVRAQRGGMMERTEEGTLASTRRSTHSLLSRTSVSTAPRA